MKRSIAIAVFIILLVAGGLAGIKVLQIQTLIAAGAAAAEPAESVSSAVVREERWQGQLRAVGTVTAVQGVTITPEIAGAVREIAFESGATVAKGDLLVRLDTSSEEAQLRAVEAQVELARVNAERARTLRADNTVSQADLDLAEATLKQHLANADAIRAVITKKTIRAPFAGKLGLRLVNLGENLDLGKPIVSLQALSPVYVEFSLPQQELARLQTGMRVTLVTDAYASNKFEGTLTAINPDLDPGTRSVRLQATFANPEQLLRPGMFARVEVLLPEERQVLVIPATAILSAPYGDSVFVIEPATNSAGGLVVRQQFVRLGRGRGDFISVEAGLKAGERIVSAGQFKLRNGMAVKENNEVVPKASEKPRPADS
ncbi:MAG TPA: efflux RND transporter periplasmic adaptor subunit [Verrucomicrobiae bacterium]